MNRKKTSFLKGVTYLTHLLKQKYVPIALALTLKTAMEPGASQKADTESRFGINRYNIARIINIGTVWGKE